MKELLKVCFSCSLSMLVSYSFMSAGELTTINGVTVYIAKPSLDYPKDKVILFLSDVFGLELINNKV